MTKAIIVDIDGTVANLSGRLHFVRQKPKDWDAFFHYVENDTPILPTLEAVSLFSEWGAYEIIFVSGRPERIRGETETWLGLNFPSPYAALLMRPDNDTRPDYIVKEEILNNILGQGYEILAVFDDRPSVIDMWKRRGLHVFQVHAPGGEDVPDLNEPGTLHLLVGPSHSGKTTWALRETYTAEPQPNWVYLSSDMCRWHLTGSSSDQSRNDEVFSLLHNMTRQHLIAGIDVVFDATNIRNKDRLAVVDQAPGNVVYHVFDRPLKNKLADLRPGFPASVVEKHHAVFQSNLKDILNGDGLPNVTIRDRREAGEHS